MIYLNSYCSNDVMFLVVMVCVTYSSTILSLIIIKITVDNFFGHSEPKALRNYTKSGISDFDAPTLSFLVTENHSS